jgi:4-aminobutyrate aminotransferase-like enzyme
MKSAARTAGLAGARRELIGRNIRTSYRNPLHIVRASMTVSCIVGAAVLRIVSEDRLQQRAAAVGARLLEKLKLLASRHELVGDVRGSGLFIGIELVTDHATLAPGTGAADNVVNHMRQAGVLIGTDGPHHNVLKVRPPMPFADEDADELVDSLDRALAVAAA